jgi:hypothetical protein
LLPNDLTPVPAAPAGPAPKDAWLGWFKSFDCGASWRSGLVPGYPQDGSAQGLASPLKGLAAGADSTVRSGTNGLFFYSGMVFNRGDNGASRIFISRYIDDNNNERGDTIRYLGAITIETGTKGQFSDKPWLAVDIPRNGYGAAALPWTVSDAGDHKAPPWIRWCRLLRHPHDPANGIPAQYRGRQRLHGVDALRRRTRNLAKIMFARSTDCGVSWNAKPISNNQKTSQGVPSPSCQAMAPSTSRGASLGNCAAIMRSDTRSTDGGKTFEKTPPGRHADQSVRSETTTRCTNTLPTMRLIIPAVYAGRARYATASGRLDLASRRAYRHVGVDGWREYLQDALPDRGRKPTGVTRSPA